MLGQRELSLDDYLVILRRRWWVVVVPTILGVVIAYIVSLKLPHRWTSQALVLIERQRVPDSFVRPVVTEDLNARLGSMQEQTLSRTRLLPLIERYGLFKDNADQETTEDRVIRMRKAIELTPVKTVVNTGYGDLPGFYVAVTLDSPRIAQQVCDELTSMFIQEDSRQREQSAQGTTDFLQSQLDRAKSRLDEQDARLAQFERRYTGSLPDERQTNLNVLTALNTQMQAATEAIRRAHQDKAYTESQLAQQVAAWEALRTGGTPQPETVDQQIAAMQNTLLALEQHYTKDHPDVIKLKSMIEQLKKLKKESAEGASKKVTAAAQTPEASLEDPPEIQRLRGQLHTYDQIIQDSTREQQRLQQAIKLYESRVQLIPAVEQEYKQITRDYQTALDFYNDLLRKKDASEMATHLERRQQGEQLRLMDSANLPEKPSFPEWQKFAAGGFAGGLALGLGLALLLEMRDKSLRTERDVEMVLRLPTLAMIPLIGNTKRSRWGDRARKRAAAAAQTLGI